MAGNQAILPDGEGRFPEVTTALKILTDSNLGITMDGKAAAVSWPVFVVAAPRRPGPASAPGKQATRPWRPNVTELVGRATGL